MTIPLSNVLQIWFMNIDKEKSAIKLAKKKVSFHSLGYTLVKHERPLFVGMGHLVMC